MSASNDTLTTRDTFALKHQIFILDAYLDRALDCDSQWPITHGFIAEFLDVLGLEALGPLGIYPAVDDRAPGWSFIQPITTSHISAHYFEKPGKGPHIRIDAYSCDSINWNDLVKVCHKHFCLSSWRGTFIDREINNATERMVIEIAGHADAVIKEYPLVPVADPRATLAVV